MLILQNLPIFSLLVEKYILELKHFIDPLTKQTGGEVQNKEKAVKFEKLVVKYQDKNMQKNDTDREPDIRIGGRSEIDISDEIIPF